MSKNAPFREAPIVKFSAAQMMSSHKTFILRMVCVCVGGGRISVCVCIFKAQCISYKIRMFLCVCVTLIYHIHNILDIIYFIIMTIDEKIGYVLIILMHIFI